MDIFLDVEKTRFKQLTCTLNREYGSDNVVPNENNKMIVLMNVNPLTAYELTKKIHDLYSVQGIKSVRPLPDDNLKKIHKTLAAGPHSKNIFLVHGRDESNLQKIKKLLKDEYHLNPIILKEKPSGGMSSVMEKLEHYGTDVGYAIILFTSDDVGKLTQNMSKPKARARQNVIFECGLFMGWLRRHRMFGLFKGANYSNLEWPTDIAGIEIHTYTKLDAKTKDRIKQELLVAGYTIK